MISLKQFSTTELQQLATLLFQQNDRKNQKIQFLESELRDEKENNDLIKNRMRNNIETLVEKVSYLQTKYYKYESEKQKKIETKILEQFHEKVKQLHLEKQELTSKVRNCDVKIQKEQQLLHEEKTFQKELVKELKEQHLKKVHQFEKEKQGLVDQIDNLEGKQKETDSRLTILQNGNKQKNSEIDRLNKFIENLKTLNNSPDQTQQFFQHFRELNDKINELKQKKILPQEKIENPNNQPKNKYIFDNKIEKNNLLTNSKQLKKLKLENKDLKEQVLNISHNYMAANRNVRNLERKNKKNKKTTAEIKNANEELKKQNRNYRNQYLIQQVEIRVLKSENEDRKILENKLRMNNEIMDQLKTNLYQSNKKSQMYLVDIEKLKLQNKSLKSRIKELFEKLSNLNKMKKLTTKEIEELTQFRIKLSKIKKNNSNRQNTENHDIIILNKNTKKIIINNKLKRGNTDSMGINLFKNHGSNKRNEINENNNRKKNLQNKVNKKYKEKISKFEETAQLQKKKKKHKKKTDPYQFLQCVSPQEARKIRSEILEIKRKYDDLNIENRKLKLEFETEVMLSDQLQKQIYQLQENHQQEIQKLQERIKIVQNFNPVEIRDEIPSNKTLELIEHLLISQPLERKIDKRILKFADPNNLILDIKPEGIEIKSATLTKLLYLITNQRIKDKNYIKIFILTFPIFSNSKTIYNKLSEQFRHYLINSQNDNDAFNNNNIEINHDNNNNNNNNNNNSNKNNNNNDDDDDKNVLKRNQKRQKRESIQTKILSIFYLWNELVFIDFEQNTELIKKLLSFVEIIDQSEFQSVKELGFALKKLIDSKLKNKKIKQENYSGLRQINSKTKPPIPNQLSDKELKLTNTLFIDLDEIELARQLTIIEMKMFQKISLREFLKKRWSKDKGKDAPNLIKFIDHFNNISSWFVKSVLHFEKLQLRVITITNLVNLGMQFLKLNNLNGVMEVVAALNHAAIMRMKNTWAKLGQEVLQNFEELSAITATEKNYLQFRKEIKKRIELKHPLIPYVGIYTKDLFAIEEGNKDWSKNSLINFTKMRFIGTVLLEICYLQKHPIQLTPVKKYKDFILKILAKDHNDQDFYLVSMKYEPRKN
ncbi:guanine nucleotide exchange factor [Anaeramoeba flamelloides]|uniref:Guanine nucleotide exchange factor n=1 Tax=Anaeramoeba flamelloides TaxID=1746091 RepID=A0ABQ8XR04_9EUKA|nr:guanine nucleotide exchange factor [Anaeramoeba flamelloides]